MGRGVGFWRNVPADHGGDYIFLPEISSQGGILIPGDLDQSHGEVAYKFIYYIFCNTKRAVLNGIWIKEEILDCSPLKTHKLFNILGGKL
jgi:hypothetical protein